MLFRSAINLVSSIELGKRMGLFGILFATAISRLCTNTWYDPYKVFKHGFGESVLPYYRRRLLYLLILIVTGAGSYWVANAISGGIWFRAIYKFIVCCIIPNLVFFLIFHKSQEFHYYLKLLKRAKEKLLSRIHR